MDFLKECFKNNKQKVLYAVILMVVALFGVYLRCFAYFSNPSMWYDEASLALNIDNNIFLPPLLNNQSAPFLFLIFAKICSCFSHSDFSYRFLPFISSIISIPVFYLFAKNWINSRLGLIFAFFIFCINFRLVYFSKEFKPYAVDVLIFMLAIICYFKIDFRKINLKTYVLSGAAFALLPLLSFPSLFILPVCYLFTIFQAKDLKKAGVFILPAIILAPVYYFAFLGNYSNNEYFQRFWADGFVNFKTLLPSVIKMLDYFTEPLSANLFILIAIIAGIIMCAVKKKKETIFAMGTIFFVVLASILHKYPMTDRLILFLLPLALVFAFKIFDVSKKKLIISILVFILGWGIYIKAGLDKTLNPDSYEREAIKGLLADLKHEYKEGEYILPLPWSDTAFLHYTKFYGFPEKYIITSNENKAVNYTKPFWNLRKGKYWLIFTIQFDNYTRYVDLQEWLARDFNVIKTYKDHYSRMYYAEKIR